MSKRNLWEVVLHYGEDYTVHFACTWDELPTLILNSYPNSGVVSARQIGVLEPGNTEAQ